MIIINENDERIYVIELIFTMSLPSSFSRSQIIKELNTWYTIDNCKFSVQGAGKKPNDMLLYTGLLSGKVKSLNIKKTIEKWINHGLNVKKLISQEDSTWLFRPQRLIVDGAVEYDFNKNLSSKPAGKQSKGYSKRLRR